MMRTLHKMLFMQFLKVFSVALLLFVFIIVFVDIFSHLYSYIVSDIPFGKIFYITVLYVPKCIHYSVPIAVLFAVSYTLGSFYANNELVAVFSSGVPLHKFVLPLLLFGFCGSIFNFLFEELVVIDTLRMKNNVYNEVMYYTSSSDGDKQRAAVFDIDKNIIYYAGSYRDANQVLNDVTLIQLSSDGDLLSRIDAREGEWNGHFWDFREVRLFDVHPETKKITESYRDTLGSEKYNKPPKFFREVTKDITELRLLEAIDWLGELKEANVAKKYRDALIEFYKRFSFTFTTFIVALISCALGSRFNKNILLYSLLMSIIIAVVYYVYQMITELFASGRLLPPFVGSWLPFFTFLIIGRILFRRART
ncbi:MAG: LptF/LptG family permease [Spirochaetia bacterium]|nr:LptF/LptG family permease [Spirochaetia bacterium]